ncbi:hypothetical protein PUNSTDRAFT_133858 [Punctularia strigosozonata HHB-11173 SS5]|uniref:uncharacterized protein n=1 Tax=Punctularia strigosozonata (strain HHB-11173) TaxID=741275 RepID=UPI000441672C|nr:uncharacterized protein PUNSTDRAFT_133858 [Punctularia strigosozonata HHB-11173 SS5]EIN10093.1 hypothetical protein PUNSTDRAFT_133858 [Punctularia strigosozonata HHB-11173 SS5]
MADPIYGRNADSIADIEDRLYDIFENHPDSHPNDAGEPVIGANALVDVFRIFGEQYTGSELMTKEEEEMLAQVLESNPGLEVTPQTILQFIAMRTQGNPEGPASHSDDDQRGRQDDRDAYSGSSRSSSRESAVYRGQGSRPPSRGPPVPKTPTQTNSPFDSSRRQRSTPLEKTAPSSWARRPMPPTRRLSDASNSGHTVTESEPTSPSSYGHHGRRMSNGGPPPLSASASEPVFSPSSHSGSRPPSRTHSRPHSRARSQPQIPFMPMGYPAHFSPGERRSHSPEDEYPRGGEDSFADTTINSVPMPGDVDSDEEVERDLELEKQLGLITVRSATSSMVSMDEQERIEALQRINDDLKRKLMEASRTHEQRLAEHESELEEMQIRLEEAKSELMATKREEKELRNKERSNSTQIMVLEAEISKLQKSLENARTAYTSLQKQYQEQCAESERYRNELRRRDQELKDYQDAAQLQQLENQKVARERTSYDERIAVLENELAIAQQAHAQLDEQKQENLMLKETIDRMRFDMDELRTTQQTGGGGSGSLSRQTSLSRTLGAELLGKMGRWEEGADDEPEEEDDKTAVDDDGDETEGEDVVQTIITRTKRRVASRANKTETIRVNEVKEYADMSVQYETEGYFLSCSSQTDPEPKLIIASSGIQTEDRPVVTFAIQTDPEEQPPAKVTMEMEIQTDEVEEATSAEEEPLASSSSTISPPTPKAAAEQLHPHDLPPTYAQVQEDREELERRVAGETLTKWHPGMQLPVQPIRAISTDAVEEWKALKEELGVDCAVIDNIIASTPKTGPRPGGPQDSRSPRKNRFYNIYNTYVYGNREEGGILPSGTVVQMLLCAGASAAVFLAMSRSVSPQYVVPGAPTYYDRMAWSSFNTMHAGGEGFPGDGTAAVWNLFGRLGGGAARIARGWPT